MIRDNIKLTSICTIKKIYEDGTSEIIDVIAGDIVTTIGKNRAASQLANSGNATEWFTHIALGTNDDAESTEDVALGAEIYRVALDNIFATGETVFGHVIIQADSIAAGTVTIKELGLLNAAVGGQLICRQVPNSELEFSGTEKLDVSWGVIVN
jgi:hypothetical protein